MLSDPIILLAAVTAILIAGVSKGGFGSAAASAATPILALATDVPTAAGIMLPLLLMMDVTGVWSYRKVLDLRGALPLMLAGLLGVGVGWALFDQVDEGALKIMLGAVSLIFVAYFVLKERLTSGMDAVAPSRVGWFARAVGWGGLAGFTSFAAHAGGPPVAMYLLPQKLSKTAYQGVTVMFFWWINLVKLGPYAALGLLDWRNLSVSLALLPLAPLAIWLGVWMHKRVSEKLYFQVILTLFALVGAKLVWDGVAEF